VFAKSVCFLAVCNCVMTKLRYQFVLYCLLCAFLVDLNVKHSVNIAFEHLRTVFAQELLV